MTHALFKYFDQQHWADEFVQGRFRMWSLAYYRDYEDKHIRRDANEGKAHHRPVDGLRGRNVREGRDIHLPDLSFTSTVKQNEIFVYCLSRTFESSLWDEFEAVTCVEIRNVPTFCRRVAAELPDGATFTGRPGHQQVGHRVHYYSPADPAGTRYSLPDQIAVSKFDRYARQREFRLAFSPTDAFAFQNVTMALEPVGAAAKPPAAHHTSYDANVGNLGDLCIVRSLRPH